jgi:hypothetical protein
MFGWLRRRRERQRVVGVDATALILAYASDAYCEARRRERDLVLPDGTSHMERTPAHWRRVARRIAKLTGHEIGLDTATRMVGDAGV